MNEDAKAGPESAFEELLDALKRGDTHRLASLLDDDFTLTHITGYRQPKSEWLAQMRADQFRYHEIRRQSTSVEIGGSGATVTGRIVTDATVYGTRANWKARACYRVHAARRRLDSASIRSNHLVIRRSKSFKTVCG